MGLMGLIGFIGFTGFTGFIECSGLRADGPKLPKAPTKLV